MNLTGWLRRSTATPAPLSELRETHTQEIEGPVNDGPPPAVISFRAEGVVEELRREMSQHPLWGCRLLRACNVGHLTVADCRYVFGQYERYTAAFTRFLAAAMAGCPDDYYRSRLAQNLWEEGGMLRPEERHAQIFREFLQRGLDLAPGTMTPEPFTERFVDQYLDCCRSASPAFVSAFLALGTEAIVPILYSTLRQGLRRAGVAEDQLKFFQLHIECDDGHAHTLTEMMMSYSGQPDWEAQVRAGMRRSLDLRLAFFESLYDGLSQRRLEPIVRRIQERRPLVPGDSGAGADPSGLPPSLLFPREARGQPLYTNTVERLNVEFAVERVPFGAEVLDPRLVHIPPGRCNERHKHAHESLFLVLCGEGRVRVGEAFLPVRPGDMVFVPRWVLHQTENHSDGEMVILAITDHGLTGKAFIGDYDRTARMKKAPEGNS
jgi:quercetin dioxygenase-like cupin family protein/pyrroloquinoline quinone (PQQ) biosynthesis protein C